MKSSKSLLMSVMMLAILATSSLAFATTTVIPLSTAGDYYQEQQYTQTVTLGSGVTEAKFDMNINLLGGTWNSSTLKTTLMYLSAASNTEIFFNADPVATSATTYTISALIDITQGAGVYVLKVVADDPWGTNTTAHWTINSASLTTKSSATPIPAAFLLLGSGLAGLFGLKQKFCA